MDEPPMNSVARARSVTFNMIVVVAGRAVVALAGLGVVVVLTRYLGPEGFGQYRTVLTYVSLIAIPAELGLYTIVLREISRPGADGGEILGAALSLRLLASASILGLGSVAALLLPYPAVVVHGIFVATFYYTALQSGILLSAVFQKHLRQGLQMSAEIAGGVTTLALIGACVAFDAGLVATIGATSCGGLVAFALAAALARRLEPFKFRIDFAAWRVLITMGLPVAGSRIAVMAILRGDVLLLSLLDTPHAVGLYGVPSKLFEVVTGITVVFAAMSMPILIAAASSADGRTFGRHVRDGVTTIALFSGGLIAFGSTFSEQILVTVAGQEFAPAAPALMLITFAIGVNAIGQLFRFALIAMELQRRLVVIDVVALILAIAAYLILIPRFSYLGAAITTASVELILCLAMAGVLTRTCAGLPASVDLLKAVIAAAIAALMRSLVAAGVVSPLAALLGGIGYLAVLVLLGAIPASYLRELVSRSEGR
jgi:O-antigen/teichoic acid export membrane protein